MRFLNKVFPVCGAQEVKSRIKSIGVFCITFVVLISSAFVGVFNSNAYLALLFCLATMIYLCNRLIVEKDTGRLAFSIKAFSTFDKKLSAKYIWLMALVVTIFGSIRGPLGMGNLIDLVVIGCGIVFVIDAPGSVDNYKWTMRLIRCFAMLYAASIWVQMLLPNVYSVFTDALRNGSDVRINKLANYYTGFTTNPVHTAGYIALGIFVYLQDLPQKKLKSYLAVAFLLISLPYTGLRMQMAAVCLCVIVFAYICIEPNKRIRLSVGLGILMLAAIAVMIVFHKQLNNIPLFRRIYRSIIGLLNGEDISSARSGLYALAIELFKKNPIFGIGWGNFRNEVPGVVTIRQKFDVHNIYLQLLCEVGVSGFMCFCIPLFYTFVKTLREYMNSMNHEKFSFKTTVLGFSLLYQIYFLVVGITDNTLYNTYSQMPYFISCAILFTCLNETDSTARGDK